MARTYKRDSIGRFAGNGTSAGERRSRNKKRKAIAGGAIGTAILPGIGTAAGAGIGYAIANSQNAAGKTPQYVAYSPKKMARRRAKQMKAQKKASR